MTMRGPAPSLRVSPSGGAIPKFVAVRFFKLQVRSWYPAESEPSHVKYVSVSSAGISQKRRDV